MAQINSGDWPIDPAATTGSELADLLNRLTAAVMSGNSGTSRPPNITAGMVWTRANASGTLDLMLFRGSSDTVLMTVSATGVITPAGTYTSTEIDNKIDQAKSDALAGSIQTITQGGGITVSGGANAKTIAHSDTSSVANASLTDGNVIQSLTFDTYGHVTGRSGINLDSRYYTQSAANNTFLRLSGGSMAGNINMPDGSRLLLSDGGGPTAGKMVIGPMHVVGSTTGLHFGQGGDWVARIDSPANQMAAAVSLVTREGGDARYAPLLYSPWVVGTVGLMRLEPGGAAAGGQVVPGNVLRPCNASGDNAGNLQSGTWRCLGYATGSSNADRTSLFQRVT